MAMAKKNKDVSTDSMTMSRMQDTIETLVRRVEELENKGKPKKQEQKKPELNFGQTKEGLELLKNQKNDPDLVEIMPGQFISRYDVLAGEWVSKYAMQHMTCPRVFDFYGIYTENKALGMLPKAAYENAIAIATGTNQFV